MHVRAIITAALALWLVLLTAACDNKADDKVDIEPAKVDEKKVRRFASRAVLRCPPPAAAATNARVRAPPRATSR